MADDNSVEIKFGASTDEALDGLGQIREALAGLTAPVDSLKGSVEKMGATFGTALPVSQIAQCAAAVGDVGSAAARAAVQVRGIGAEVSGLQQKLAQQKILLGAEVDQYKITQDQKYALL